MIIRVALAEAVRRFDNSETPQLDAQLLLMDVLNCNRTYLYTWPDKELTEAQYEAFMQRVEARCEGQPIAHLLGFREFWSLQLEVNASTLIPRPDTEHLVETALSLVTDPVAKVLELGTGTGAIALALASERPNWQIDAVERSADALALAMRNRDRHDLKQVSLWQSDWFQSVTSQDYQLIVSNPPYIDATDPHLNQGDVRFEPHSALVAEDEGFADLFHIILTATTHLCAGGWLILEHGAEQGKTLRNYFAENGYERVNTARDYANLERVTYAQWNKLARSS